MGVVFFITGKYVKTINENYKKIQVPFFVGGKGLGSQTQ